MAYLGTESGSILATESGGLLTTAAGIVPPPPEEPPGGEVLMQELWRVLAELNALLNRTLNPNKT